MIWRSISTIRLVALAMITCSIVTCSSAQSDANEQQQQQPFTTTNSTSKEEQLNVSSREAVIHTSSAAGEIHILEPKEWYNGDSVHVNVSTQQPNFTNTNQHSSPDKPIYLNSYFDGNSSNEDAQSTSDAESSTSVAADQYQQFNSSSVLDEIVNKLLANDNPLNLHEANQQVSVITDSPAPSSYVQVISINSPVPVHQQQQLEGSTFDEVTQPLTDEESYQRDQMDRHIQYDITSASPPSTEQDYHQSGESARNSARSEQRQKLHPRQVSPNEGEEKSTSSNKLETEISGDEKSSEAQNQTQGFAMNVLAATDSSSPVKTTLSQQVNVEQQQQQQQQQQTIRKNLTSTDATAEVVSGGSAAPKQLLNGSQQEMASALAATTATGGGRTGGVQARSMSSAPVAPPAVKGQHTRPPYASYDQFHQRSDVSANQRNQVLDYEMPTVNLTVSPGTLSSNNTPSTSAAHEVLGALNRISGQLANEIAQQQQQQQHSVVRPKQSATDNNRERHQMSIDSKQQQLNDLATLNQMVDLNAIPVGATSNLINADSSNHQQQHSGLENGVNRFYLSKENQLFNFYAPQVLNHRGPSERYSSNQDTTHESLLNEVPRSSASYLDQSTAINAHNNNNNNNNHHHHQQQQQQQQRRPSAVDDAPPVADYPTTYYAANSNSELLDHQRATSGNSATSGLMHQNDQHGSNKHYAASLINVTAPMIPPLSATEAMEATLGEQTFKNLLHHVSGFIRPQGASTGGASVMSGGGDKMRQNLYFMPTSNVVAAESQLQSIYSQPANQYSTKAPTTAAEQQQVDALIANNTASYLEERMRLDRNNNYMLSGRKPSGAYVAPNITQTHQASGFRSPLHSSLLNGGSSSSSSSPSSSSTGGWPSTRQPVPTSYLNLPSTLNSIFQGNSLTPAASMNIPSSYAEVQQHFSTTPTSVSSESATISSLVNSSSLSRPPVPQPSAYPGNGNGGGTTVGNQQLNNNNGSTGAAVVTSSSLLTPTGSPATSQQLLDSSGLSKRVNLTRVEHISAECSNDLIRTVIIFNGTFKGIIYSSGYVRDPSCLYINGTGKTKYDFSIRMNQCGTLGTQKVHPSGGPNEVRRRDQLMWNTLSIQYNPIIEQEWDEHFRVSCEYGSDFWKTISFSPFNVETNTGSPVLFTVNPPQCQMEILRGHGMVGPRQEAVSGPVTVGDPLTLLIHMKSEKAGYDILVKNCIAHNGGAQKMQLIDNNGCVVNERFISPFRGTYNDNEMKHVTLYSYLKAFRFTGSPILYLECEIHMCQSSCPPQMCYWRRLSKRSANETHLLDGATYEPPPADQLVQEGEEPTQVITTTSTFFPDSNSLEQQQQQSVSSKIISSQHRGNRTTGKRRLRNLDFGADEDEEATSSADKKRTMRHNANEKRGASKLPNTKTTPAAPGPISDRVSLFQALEVRQEHDPEMASYSIGSSSSSSSGSELQSSEELLSGSAAINSLMCYRRAEVLAFLFTAGSVFLVAISVTIGCCLRAVNLRKQQRCAQGKQLALDTSPLSSSANHLINGSSSPLSHNSSSSSNSGSGSGSCRSSLCSVSNRSPGNSNNQRTAAADAIYHHQQQQHSVAQRLSALSAVVPILQNHSTRHKVRPY